MSESRRTESAVPSTGNCPDGELLLAFLTAAVDPETARRLDVHLDECDACLELLANAQNRLARSVEIDEAVPPALSDRMAAVPPQRAARSAGDRHVAHPASRRVRRLPITPALRFITPWALAASLLLVLASQNDWFTSTPQRLTRAVPMSQKLKVTAREVQVRDQPHLQAQVVAKLTRGDVVEVGGEDREWYRIVLAGGSEGWVEQNAFR